MACMQAGDTGTCSATTARMMDRYKGIRNKREGEGGGAEKIKNGTNCFAAAEMPAIIKRQTAG